MKKIPVILLTIIFGVTAFYLYYCIVNLKMTCDVLNGDSQWKTRLLYLSITQSHQQIRRDAARISELEKQVTALAGGKNRPAFTADASDEEPDAADD